MGAAPGIGELGDRQDALDALVARARTTIPFYRDHLARVRHVELAALPTSSKADLGPYGRFPLSAGRLADFFRVSATSGTTGPRMFVGYSRADWQAVGAACARMCAHVGFGPGDSLLNLLGGGLWVGGPCFDLLADVSGAALVNTGPMGPQQLFEWVPEMGITGLTATPSYLRLLVEVAEAEGADLSGWPLRLGFLGGEGASTELRRQVCAAMPDAFVWQETYGSTEVGGAILAYAPPAEPLAGHLLAATDEFAIELLHPERDEAVEPGEVGEITVTSFREASPLIRYRTRDLAAAIDAPRDASGLPRMTTVVGRIDDALKVRGALVYPSVIEDALVARLAPGAEWRVVVSRDHAALDVLTVRVEADDAHLADDLAADLARRLLVRPVVEVVAPGSFERFGGKARRVLDERPAG